MRLEVAGRPLHGVLDTSGSLVEDLPYLLGLIASFCEQVDAGEVHLLQCDTTVTADEWVTPEGLRRHTLFGAGGSDLTPAMLRLADDPTVEAALVLTDGCIDYPREPMPYSVLWGLLGPQGSFLPPYGQVLELPEQPADQRSG